MLGVLRTSFHLYTLLAWKQEKKKKKLLFVLAEGSFRFRVNHFIQNLRTSMS